MKETVDLHRVKSAYEYVARMVAERPDGEIYLPVFERLEREIAALETRETAIERARRISREKLAAAA